MTYLMTKPDDSCTVCGVERGTNHVHEIDWESIKEQKWEERQGR